MEHWNLIFYYQILLIKYSFILACDWISRFPQYQWRGYQVPPYHIKIDLRRREKEGFLGGGDDTDVQAETIIICDPYFSIYEIY